MIRNYDKILIDVVIHNHDIDRFKMKISKLSKPGSKDLKI
jgi:hypothetical protein